MYKYITGKWLLLCVVFFPGITQWRVTEHKIVCALSTCIHLAYIIYNTISLVTISKAHSALSGNFILNVYLKGSIFETLYSCYTRRRVSYRLVPSFLVPIQIYEIMKIFELANMNCVWSSMPDRNITQF